MYKVTKTNPSLDEQALQNLIQELNTQGSTYFRVFFVKVRKMFKSLLENK